MISNITITGWDYGLNKRLAEEIASRLAMFYLSFTDLIVYSACDRSKDEVIRAEGESAYKKLVHTSAASAGEYCNSVIAVNAEHLDGFVKEKLARKSAVVFINSPLSGIRREGTLYARQRFKGFYSVFLNAAGKNEGEIIDEIFSALQAVYGEGDSNE